MREPPQDKNGQRRQRQQAQSGRGLSVLSAGWRGLLSIIRTENELASGQAYGDLLTEWDTQEFDDEALGHGYLAERADLEKRDLLGPDGIPIGFLDGDPILYPRGASGLVYGPPGIGKDTSLITHLLGHIFDRSLFCIDVAGESRAMSGKHRATKQGRKASVIAPWLENSTCYNPISPLIDYYKSEKQKRDQPGKPVPLGLMPYEVAKGFVPPPKGSSDNAWVRRGAVNLVAELLRLGTITREERCTPGWTFDQLNGGDDTLEKAFMTMRHCGDPVLEQAGTRYAKRMTVSPREFGFIVDEAAEFLMIYQEGSPLRTATSRTDITPAELKKEPRTVFFEIPGDQMYVARQYVAAVLNSFIEGTAMASGPDYRTRTLFLANEFTQIGVIPSLRKSLRLYRKYGVQHMLYAQSRAAIEELYGEEGRRDIEENCEFIQILGTDDPGLMKTISDWSGTKTVAIREASLSGGPTPSVNEQIKLGTRPVLQNENIRSLEMNEQIIKFQNMPLILAERRYWKDDPYLSEVLEEPSSVAGVVK